MLKKVIFSVLALLVMWGLGNVLYETWIQGHVYYTSSRTHITYDSSYASNRFGFFATFSFQVFLTLVAVVSLLGLGWIKKDSGSIWKSSAGAGFSTANIPLKVRLRWVGVGLLALMVFTAYNILMCHLQRVPIPGVLWFALIGCAVAAAIIFRALLRQSESVG